MSEFASPAEATGMEWSTLNGVLLIVEVLELVKEVQTVFGLKDAVRANVTPVDGPSAGAAYLDTLVFPKALVSQLAPNMGKSVLGRLTQGQPKPGQKAPWLLTEATAEDKKTAAEFLASRLTADDI